MSEPRRFERSYEIYSPRWGHADSFSVKMTLDELVVGNGDDVCCRLDANGDPQWDGSEKGYDLLMDMFANEAIYPSIMVPEYLEWAWERWKEKTSTDDETAAALEELFAWISRTVENRPTHPLWEGLC